MTGAPRETYALGLLGEEMGEAAQAIGKWLRFGPDHVNRLRVTPRVTLTIELGDVMAAIEYAILAGLIDRADVGQAAHGKLQRLLDANAQDDQGQRLAPAVQSTTLDGAS